MSDGMVSQQQNIIQLGMSIKNRTFSISKDDNLIKTMHNGFNYFHQIDFHSESRRRVTRQRHHTVAVNQSDHQIRQQLLVTNKEQFNKIKTQLHQLRQIQLNDYVRKSLRYQQILNINDTKKKRLPTLNAKVGEVVKKAIKETIGKNLQYLMLTTAYKLDWKPQSREGHTTVVFKNSAIVLGGHCSHPFDIGQVYSFDSQSWIKQFQLPSARSYHSSILYKNRYIIVFGGMGTYDVSRKCRVCYNSIYLIDLQTFTSRILKMSNEQAIQGRRNHGCASMGKYMIILGGMNTKREFLKDFFYLDLQQLRWYHKQYKIQGKQLNEQMESGIAKHKIIAHFRNTHKKLPLYSSEYNEHEGLYIFGGFFGNGSENVVLFLGFNNYNPYLKKLEYTGIPPSSLDPLVQKINENLLAIISGESSERCIRLFRIKQREFIGVYKYLTPPFFGGIGSTLSNYNGQIYIFFGITDNGYIGNVHSFKIDQRLIETIEEKKRNRLMSGDWKSRKLSSNSNSDQS